MFDFQPYYTTLPSSLSITKIAPGHFSRMLFPVQRSNSIWQKTINHLFRIPGRCHLWVSQSQRPIRRSSVIWRAGFEPATICPTSRPNIPFSGFRQNQKVVYNPDKYLYCLLVSLYYHFPLRPVKALYLPILAPFRRKANNLPGFGQKCSIWALYKATGVFWKFSIEAMNKTLLEKISGEGLPARPGSPYLPRWYALFTRTYALLWGFVGFVLTMPTECPYKPRKPPFLGSPGQICPHIVKVCLRSKYSVSEPL